MTKEEKEVYYNKIMVQDTMSVEEAENIIDDMYQDKYNVIEEKNTIYLDRLDDVKFTNLEFASVRMLREVQKLRRELEKQQKEIEEKDKQIDRLSLVRQEVSYGYDNTYLITNEKLAIIERNTYKIEVEEGVFVDIRKLYDDYKDSIPKEAIREKIKEIEIETESYYKNGYYDTGAKMILKELLGE